MPIKVLTVRGYDELSERAAEIIADAIRNKPNLVLGLATGGTPVGCYRKLIRMHKEEGLDFSKVVTFNLDEYIGLSSTHPQSYRYFMDEKLFNHVDIKIENTHIPNGLPDNLQRTCKEFEETIKRFGGIDLQLLGIGTNGHIAFNEPSSPFDSRTRIITISEETRMSNARFFQSIDEVPRQSISMGIGTIMEARKIVLLASGAGKANVIVNSVEGSITTDVPASILQKHLDCTFILDEVAASKLTYK